MQGMGDGASGETCPVEFNFDETTFKVGDMVSYRVTGSLQGFPFAGKLAEVHEDYVVILQDENDPTSGLRGTRESRPVVQESEVA